MITTVAVEPSVVLVILSPTFTPLVTNLALASSNCVVGVPANVALPVRGTANLVSNFPPVTTGRVAPAAVGAAGVMSRLNLNGLPFVPRTVFAGALPTLSLATINHETGPSSPLVNCFDRLALKASPPRKSGTTTFPEGQPSEVVTKISSTSVVAIPDRLPPTDGSSSTSKTSVCDRLLVNDICPGHT